MRRILEALVSLRVTAVILVVLSALLLVNVAVPQAAVDPAGYARLAKSGPVARFLVEDLGLGRISTSPLFVATLVAFFLNLVAVLIDRTGSTLRRVRFAPPTEAQVRAMTREAIELPAGGADPATAERVLGDLGFRTARVGTGILWGVKHRLALLGFPLFHAAFLVLAAGGLQLYLTRHVVNTGGAEGEEIDGTRGAVVRSAPLGPPPPFRVLVERVEPRLERGSPVDLAVTLRRTDLPGPAHVSRVNDPATWGPLSLLVDRVGIAPVLWLQDEAGFTLDRVAVVTSGGTMPTRVELAGSGLEAVVEPVPVGAGFPERGALGTVPVTIRLVRENRALFDGTLRPGEAVKVGERLVVLEEVRYWAGIRAVHERGGELLIAGFLLLVAGILWRMLLYRRDVVVVFDPEAVRIGGRSDFNPGRFRDELHALRSLLSAGPLDVTEKKP